MISKSDTIIKECYFVFEKEKLIARLYYHEGTRLVYGEIVRAQDNQRVANMKGVAREYLKKYGIDIPTDAKRIVTHSAVRKLVEVLENEK